MMIEIYLWRNLLVVSTTRLCLALHIISIEITVAPFERKVNVTHFVCLRIQLETKKKNFRLWSNEQPQKVMQTCLYLKIHTVWCGFYAGCLFKPFFLESKAGANVTVSRQHYRDLLNPFYCCPIQSERLEFSIGMSFRKWKHRFLKKFMKN